MPAEVIWEGYGRQKPFREVTLDGTHALQIEDLADGTRRVVRLNSTNPSDYLNPLYSPGRIY